MGLESGKVHALSAELEQEKTNLNAIKLELDQEKVALDAMKTDIEQQKAALDNELACHNATKRYFQTFFFPFFSRLIIPRSNFFHHCFCLLEVNIQVQNGHGILGRLVPSNFAC